MPKNEIASGQRIRRHSPYTSCTLLLFFDNPLVGQLTRQYRSFVKYEIFVMGQIRRDSIRINVARFGFSYVTVNFVLILRYENGELFGFYIETYRILPYRFRSRN